MIDTTALDRADIAHAVPIAEGVWWVGHYLPGDAFQCHVYLIEHGDQSVLLDPGSYLTIGHTLEKIAEVIPFERIRYFVCHHQDPDITSSMKVLDERIVRPDAVLVTDWRAQALLKHYDLRLPFWLVDQNGWRLDLGGRELRFVFTPYLHFPGAFCTFDTRSGILFSSDLFGGFTENWSLVARDEGYFEAMRPFHEHYMPSRDILLHGLRKLEELPIRMIAPQHGSIIPERLVATMFAGLKELDCGLYLMTQGDIDFRRLSRINQMLQDIMDVLTRQTDFREIAAALLEIARRLLPVERMEFFAAGEMEEGLLRLSPDNEFRGELVSGRQECEKMLGIDEATWLARYGAGYRKMLFEGIVSGDGRLERRHALVLPLFSPNRERVHSLALLWLREEAAIDEEAERMLSHLRMPLGVAVEREAIYCLLDLEHKQLYERSIRDPLTGLYNRIYMQDTLQRLFDIHDRDPNAAVAVAIFDVDHFKSVNDNYGHNWGDEVLKKVGTTLVAGTRSGDLPVRLGGEEFAVFMIGLSAQYAPQVAERIRDMVSRLVFDGPMAGKRVTISAGIAHRRQNEELKEFIGRADAALYEAKEGGRNRVCIAAR